MPKKPVRNGFYFYMQELLPILRREGREFPNGMADVVPVAHPRWKQLPQKERDRYDAMAKREKARLRGQAGDVYREDNQGNILAHRKDKYTELEKRRMAERKQIVKNWPPGKAMKRESFYFINFQYLCETDDGVFIPAEIAAVEYSIERGITKQLHRFIEPGKIPTGYRFTCVQNSESTHKIPVEGFNQADANYMGLWIQLKNFINPNGEKPEYPPLYCLGATNNYKAVEGCLEWIHGRACMGEPNVFHKVFEVESLFKEIYAHLGKEVSKTRCINRLANSDWDYHPNTRCPYHDELEVKDCALGIVNRYAYTLSDSLCQEYFDVELTSDHVPATIDTGSVTVLSPSSMPVCPHQEARLPEKVDNFFKGKKQPPQKIDYQELRRPKPVEPSYPAPAPVNPAWGGAMGGASAMGGVNSSIGRGSAPAGRGSLPMGRAGLPVNDPYSDDYPPMPGGGSGRGVSVGMQATSPKKIGRGSFVNQSTAYDETPKWQQPSTMSNQGPSGGIGRGLFNRPPVNDDMPALRRPGQPQASMASNGNPTPQSYDDDMPALRRPGQTLAAPSQSSYAPPPQQTYAPPPQASSHAPVTYSSNVSQTQEAYHPVGRGRGGILEDLLQSGVRPGVPCGRGRAPPDIVAKMSALGIQTT